MLDQIFPFLLFFSTHHVNKVKSELTESTQNVRGMIIAHEDDLKIRRALSVTQDIEFYTYKIDFQLKKYSELL